MLDEEALRPWEKIFPEADRILQQKIGYGIRQAFGKKPALLIIDVTTAFIGSRPLPPEEAVKEYPTSCGEIGWKTLPDTEKLLVACRARHVPVVFTISDYLAGRFSVGPVKRAVPRTNIDPKANEIPESIRPLPSELVIPKVKASGFFGTPLLSCLQSMGIDSLLIVGCVTSGCVRASVVDAFNYGFRCFVVEECTFDRFELSHLVNLFDMNAKYADVISLNEALEHVASI